MMLSWLNEQLADWSPAAIVGLAYLTVLATGTLGAASAAVSDCRQNRKAKGRDDA